MENEWAIQWWIDYIHLDPLKRRNMVESLPFVTDIINLAKNENITEEYKKYMISLQLHSYFEDCVENCYYVYGDKTCQQDMEGKKEEH